MNYDYLIVGAGLFGAVFAHEMKKQGMTCLVIEKRDHLAGNIYTQEEHGIQVHKYGAHIFHTSDKEVWEYVNQFAEFNHYVNSPVAVYKDELYNLPFNMNTFSKMWGIKTPAEARAKIDEQLAEANITEPQNLEEQAISLVGRDVYEKLIKGYTEKQWGRDCTDLPAFIIKRLPLRFTYDNNYFNDRYQGIPIGGYTQIVEKLLDGIEVKLGVEYDEFVVGRGEKNSGAETADVDNVSSDDKCYGADSVDKMSADNEKTDANNADCVSTKITDINGNTYNKVLYTGPVDEYFDFKLGELEYRSLRFETDYHADIDNFQGNAVVNYTEREIPYTRIIEHKHFEFGKGDGTYVTREYPATWSKGDEPYYPVNNDRNNDLYKKYEELANQEGNVLFGGRLGQYKYYDMDKVIRAALEMVADELSANA